MGGSIMFCDDFTQGRVVLSKQGRDKGRYFIIFEVVSDDFLLVVDGDLRKLNKPKLKRKKHLKALPYMADSFLEKIKNKTHILDSDIRTELDKFRKVL